jgi:hypothetical protein
MNSVDQNMTEKRTMQKQSAEKFITCFYEIMKYESQA